MKTKLVLLFTAVLALTSLSSCVDPYGYGGGYGGGYGSSCYRPLNGGYSSYGTGYRGPSYGGSCGYSGHHGGYGGGGYRGHPGGFGGWGGFGGHHY